MVQPVLFPNNYFGIGRYMKEIVSRARKRVYEKISKSKMVVVPLLKASRICPNGLDRPFPTRFLGQRAIFLHNRSINPYYAVHERQTYRHEEGRHDDQIDDVLFQLHVENLVGNVKI